MKKSALGFIASAMMFMAGTAIADEGAIRSIDPCDEYGYVIDPGTIDTSLSVGETAYFRIRLQNLNSGAIFAYNLKNPWFFEYFLGGTVADSTYVAQQWAINPPKIGIYVSGRFTMADIVSFGPPSGEEWFTDFICSYKVQPGDLALPVTLANKNGGMAADSETTEYFLGIGLKLASPWRLVGYKHESSSEWSTYTTNVCMFSYGNYWVDDEGVYLPASVTDATGNKTRDYTLFNAGIFIKSIDFDKNKETVDEAIFGTNEVWRAVHERSTGTKEFVPSLFIPGEVPEDYTGIVYLWSADESSVMLPDATMPVNGTMVQKLNLDGSPESLQFRLRGVTQGTKTEIFLSSTITNVVSGSGRTITNFVSRTVACIAPLAPRVSVLANGNSTYTLNATDNYTNSVPFKVELTQAWTNNEDVVVKFKYCLTNSTEQITSAEGVTNLTKDALIAISAEQQYGYDEVLPLSVTIPAGETDSIELDTNVRALYALGALTSANKGDKLVITPYFDDPAMTDFFAVKPLTLSLYGMAPKIVSTDIPDHNLNVDEGLYEVRGGETVTLNIGVKDTYRNMFMLDGTNGYYTVRWSVAGGAETTVTNDVNGNMLIPAIDYDTGVLPIRISFPVPSAVQSMTVKIKVMNADGRQSEKSFAVLVKPPLNVTAEIASTVVGEGGAPNRVTFRLSDPQEPDANRPLWAFLEPANAVASNLSYAAFFTTNTVKEAERGSAGVGVPFGPGELEAISDALQSGNGLKFLDNASDHFVYNIRLCSTSTWDPSARVTQFVENQLIVDVTNSFPVITQIRARRNNASPGDPDKLTTSTIVMSLSDPMNTFRVSVLNDVDLDKGGVESNQVVYSWEVYRQEDGSYPATPNLVFYTVGTNSTLNMEDLFGTTLTPDFCGLYRFSVRAQDKDMRGLHPEYLYYDTTESKWVYNPWRGIDTGGAVSPAYPEGDALNPGNDWSGAYVFELRINENPYVEANPIGAFTTDSDGTPIFSESDLLNGEKMGFTVAFNDKPNISGFLGVQVAVTITPVDADGNEVDFGAHPEVVPPYVLPKASTTNFSFTASKYSSEFTFKDFDGTWWGRGLTTKGMRYRMVAAVTSTGASPSTTPWNELYSPATNYFRLENSVPVVTVDPDYAGQDSETNAMMGVTYAPNEQFNFRWSLSDVPSDREQDYTAEKIAALGDTNLIVTCTVIGGYEVGSITNQSSGAFKVWFEKPGIQKLRITAKDKDGGIGYSQVVWFFVETSKNVFLYPYGPSRSSVDSDEIAKYFDQPGLGVGRVWSDGSFGSIKAFRHTWTYGTSTRTAEMYAQGYGAGERDESTAAGKSTAPKQNGDGVGTDTDRYTNPSIYDSFFYRWFKMEPGKGGSGNSSSGGGEWTAIAPSPAKKGDATLNLPTEQTDYTYPDSSALAVFSHELYVADNMGDINGDAIPDVFAVRTWTSGTGETKRLYDIVSGGGGGEGDSSSVNDLVDIAPYNGDEDFMPQCWAVDANPLKPEKTNWGPGLPFKALYEIRGVGVSGTGVTAHHGLNEPGVSDYDLSPAETCALLADYVAATNELTGVYATDYAAATNWATATGWTPEAISLIGVRLNPAKADTDDDGFDDGWEYYFWYYAKIGAIVDGVWSRLEGRRFDIKAPATGTRIASKEIEDAFNPHTVAAVGRDFDGDGLTDLEEYVLGTSPIDWDSDGDGMNDLWEVLFGLDPLDAGDASGNRGNPDGDFMALSEYADDTFTVFTFADGQMFGLPTATDPKVTVQPVASGVVTNGYLMAVEQGGVTNLYITETQQAVGALADDVNAFPAVESGGTIYLAGQAAVTVVAGTEVVEVGASEEEFSLISGHFGAKVVGSKEKVWFVGRPKVFVLNGEKVSRLAEDTLGYSTFTYDGVAYLGEERTFPAGTRLESIDTAVSDMAKATIEPYTAVSGGFSWVNPGTLDREPTPLALPLFSYGISGKTIVPSALSVNQDQYVAAPVTVEDVARNPLVSTNVFKVTLIHNQVREQFGFDPRTAWMRNSQGLVSSRWEEGSGHTGSATNTVAYSTRDEYLVMQFRQQLGTKLMDGVQFVGSGTDNVPPGATVKYFSRATTNPKPLSAESGSNEEDLSGLRTVEGVDVSGLRISAGNHGADTDGDGIPDGWELYVNASPNDGKENAYMGPDDGDDLKLFEEFAGVDSCNAYPDVESITRNHPGRNDGWWNKFFPTDPYAADTDGDGVLDHAEGMKIENGKRSYKVDFYVGSTWYGAVSTSFIYGKDENAEAYDADGSTICFRGGGLNPCTVDTDGDLLPDAWEFEFAGMIFKDGAPVKWKPQKDDLRLLTMADGKQKAAGKDTANGSGYEIRGGMDGTWGPYNNRHSDVLLGDACYDFDHDGLVNCQEYLVQTLRHLRYDDDKTPLMGIDPSSKKFLKFLPFSAWDGEFFRQQCLASGFAGTGSWQFRELGYFTRPPHEWDMLAQDPEGNAACKNYESYEGVGYRVLLPPYVEIPMLGLWPNYVNGAMQYACTDPRRWDTDEDGMDDYYELFHGLNPLLGTAANPVGTDDYGWLNDRYDVIAQIHGLPNMVSAWCNFWTGWNASSPPPFDAMRYPWMIGTMECDADGDGLRNDEEAIKVNLAKPTNTHTDPTPLWMTDSTSVDHASFTSQYYCFDPYIVESPDFDPNTYYPDVLAYPWPDISLTWRKRSQGVAGESRTWMFSFEENEGYDTDHDFRRDTAELVKGVEMASDPKLFSDLDRRQALYFPGLVNGIGSAAMSRDGQFRRAVSSEPDLLKQFTVECWAKPEGALKEAVLVERVCNYGPSTLSNNTSVLRANFRVGIDDLGRAYGEFQGSTSNSPTARVTAPISLTSNVWTHIAFTFDGTDAKLYLNGNMAPVATMTGVGLIPANGVSGILQDYSAMTLDYGYVALPCATVLGASVSKGDALLLSSESSWNDFNSNAYFKGWIDEVRVWDGARTPAEISANFKVRLTMDDIKKLRTNDESTGIFDKWVEGATRANGGLPPELLQHYNFVTLPGGVEPQNVMTEPSGFQENVFDNVRKPNSRVLDNSLLAGWWFTTPLHSKVYWNYAVIPWIGNTVAHLPFMDGSSADSQYWATTLAGAFLPGTQGFGSYDYPNEANPYPYFLYHRERNNRLKLLSAIENGSNASSNEVETAQTGGADVVQVEGDLATKWLFQLRSDFLGTSDLVPLGGAYAKRGTDFWDGQGAMDAWAETAAAGEVADTDGDGIPDWAEALGYTTAEAYLRALREGLLPDGTIDAAYRDIADVNDNGIADWWERFYGVTGYADTDDPDHDGLSIAAEYLAGIDYDGTQLDPLKTATDGLTIDYFLKMTNEAYKGWYFGEVLADHDFMEDEVEGEMGFNRYAYDANLDKDGNGWDNWSEMRARFNDDTWVQLGTRTNLVVVTFAYDSNERSIFDATNQATIALTEYHGKYRDVWDDSIGEVSPCDFVRYTLVGYEPIKGYGGRPLPTINLRVYGVEKGTTNLAVYAYTDSKLAKPDAVFMPEGAVSDGILTARFAGEGLKQGLNTFVAVSGSGTGFARGVNVGYDRVDVDIALSSDAIAFDVPAQSNATKTLVRVVRTAINGVELERQRSVYARTLNLTAGKTFTEADLIKEGEWDFDWRRLVSDANTFMGIGREAIRSASYEVYVGSDATNAYTTFTREFQGTDSAPSPSGTYTNTEYIVASARPTLRWQPFEGYRAFALQIAKDDVFNEVVYATTNFMPAVELDGCRFTPDIYVGEDLEDGKVYYWRVAQLNSKFTKNVWSEVASFRTAVDSTKRSTGFGRLAADVRYFGPADADISNVVVGVYSSPDFASKPVALKHLSGEGKVESLTNDLSKAFSAAVTNVCFDGIAPGSYYVMAFIDINTNGVRDAYESWGYVNKFGTDAEDTYSPVALEVVVSKGTPVSAYLVMEDTDVNHNGLVDCLEDMSSWLPPSAVVAGLSDDADGDGLNTDTEDDFGTAPDNWDTDGDLMSDGWEALFADTDPVTPDADDVVAGDVMAYAVTNLTVVTVWDGSDVASATNKYVLLDRTIVLEAGAAVSNLAPVLARAYDYAGTAGLGKAASSADLSNMKVYEVYENAEVVLVHAQVYDAFGFSPFTANPVAYAEGTSVNTKPFTAIDKYLVCRYLENVYGLADEVYMNTNRLWSSFTLKPGDPDNNRDGIPDGWELYVMFGPDGATTTLAEAKISPLTNGVAWVEHVRKADSAPDGGDLSILGEYDHGNTPTDPWAKDTDRDGVADAKAYRYHLKGDDAAKDFDGDGLPNYAEYLITEVFGYGKCDADNAHTIPGQLDYFQKVGSLYVGEIFTDHDMMEDDRETEWAEIGANRYIYDANRDSDRDGWSNFAEIRAKLAMGRRDAASLLESTTNEVSDAELAAYTNTWVYAGQPDPNVEMTVYYSNGSQIDGLIVQAFTDAKHETCDAVFAFPSYAGAAEAHLVLNASSRVAGYLREGKTDFVVFAGQISDATNALYRAATAYASGAPLGIARGVDVGWSAASFEVKLADAVSVVDRVMVASDESGRAAVFGEGAVYRDVKSEEDEGFSSSGSGNSSNSGDASASVRNVKHIRIVPYKAKGTAPSEHQAIADENGYIMLDQMGSTNRVVAEFDLDVAARPFIHEGDILADGIYDLDWVGFRRNISQRSGVTAAIGNVRSVLYRVVVGYGDIGRETYLDTNTVVEALETLIERRFEINRTAPTLVSPGANGDNVVYSAQPTFRWTMAGEDEWASRFGSSYTAFRLQVKNGSAVVYDSGVRLAPAPDANGVYSWTPPIYANDQSERAAVLTPGNTYTWSVAMYNAKFTDDPSTMSTAAFTFAPNLVQEVNDHGYGSIDVCVKYFGPGAVIADASTTNSKIRVEAYASPDFTGEPASRAFISSGWTTADAMSNVRLVGLKPGTYYVRAFLDSNGDFKRSEWESWGYANYRGEPGRTADVFTPKPVTIATSDVHAPLVNVWIEDTDNDNDCLPDAWEWDRSSKVAATFLDEVNSTPITDDGLAISKDFADAMCMVANGISSGLAGSGFTLLQDKNGVELLINGGGTATTWFTIDSLKPQIQEGTIEITGLRLEGDNVILTMKAKTAVAVNGTVAEKFSVDQSQITVTIVVKHANSLDGEWTDHKVEKTLSIVDGDVESTEYIKISDLGLDASKGFFKIEVE